MKPKSRPQENRNQVMARLMKAKLQSKDMVYLVGVRGYYLNSMGQAGENDLGIYDDAIFLVTPSGMYSFNANTDPSREKPGIAKLVPGIHRYRPDYHNKSRPWKMYMAFRPATPDESLPVTRHGREGIHKGIAINIHKGGYTTTSSEGCQTIYPDQWAEFYRLTREAMKREGQKEIDYILIENS